MNRSDYNILDENDVKEAINEKFGVYALDNELKIADILQAVFDLYYKCSNIKFVYRTKSEVLGTVFASNDVVNLIDTGIIPNEINRFANAYFEKANAIRMIGYGLINFIDKIVETGAVAVFFFGKTRSLFNQQYEMKTLKKFLKLYKNNVYVISISMNDSDILEKLKFKPIHEFFNPYFGSSNGKSNNTYIYKK